MLLKKHPIPGKGKKLSHHLFNFIVAKHTDGFGYINISQIPKTWELAKFITLQTEKKYKFKLVLEEYNLLI